MFSSCLARVVKKTHTRFGWIFANNPFFLLVQLSFWYAVYIMGHAISMSLRKSGFLTLLPPPLPMSQFVMFWFDPPPPCHSPKSDKRWGWKLTKNIFHFCPSGDNLWSDQNALMKQENVKGCTESFIYIWIFSGGKVKFIHSKTSVSKKIGGVTSLLGLLSLPPMSHFVRFLVLPPP